MTKKHRKKKHQKKQQQNKKRAGQSPAVSKPQEHGPANTIDATELVELISPPSHSGTSHRAIEPESLRQSGIPRLRHEAEPRPKDEEWSREIRVAMVSLATNAWRAKIRMVDPETKEPRAEMRRVFRHIEGMYNTFGELGLRIIDQTHEPYDSGMPLKVLSWEETPGLLREEIKETIKPSITAQGRLLQVGEVIVGTPVQATTDESRGDR